MSTRSQDLLATLFCQRNKYFDEETVKSLLVLSAKCNIEAYTKFCWSIFRTIHDVDVSVNKDDEIDHSLDTSGEVDVTTYTYNIDGLKILSRDVHKVLDRAMSKMNDVQEAEFAPMMEYLRDLSRCSADTILMILGSAKNILGEKKFTDAVKSVI